MSNEAEDWYWAAGSRADGDTLAGDKFVIASGKDELWRRVRNEIDPGEHVSGWDAVHRGHDRAGLDDILNLLLVVASMYGVNRNRFVFEAAQIPAFARYLRDARHDLCNYVSNPVHPELPMLREPYADEHMRHLGRVVSGTLGVEPDWF